MSNSWASGGHIACWQPCRGPHDVFDLEITTSLGNDLCNVAQSEHDLKKKGHYLPSFSRHRPSSGIVSQKSSAMARSGVDLQMKKNLDLSSFACVKGFKRLFGPGPHLKAPRASFGPRV